MNRSSHEVEAQTATRLTLWRAEAISPLHHRKKGGRFPSIRCSFGFMRRFCTDAVSCWMRNLSGDLVRWSYRFRTRAPACVSPPPVAWRRRRRHQEAPRQSREDRGRSLESAGASQQVEIQPPRRNVPETRSDAPLLSAPPC